MDKNQETVSDLGFATRALTVQLPKEEWDCSSGMMPAITTAATFVMSSAEEIDGELLYGRYGNPSRNSVEAVLASLEGAKHAMCFSSGMAAINAVLETLKSGDHVLASNKLYGGSFNLIRNGLPKIGIDATMVDIFDKSQIQKALQPNTKLVWFELCTNPHIMVADLRKIVNLVKCYNSEIIIGVDNTFLSPWTVRPLELGADLVMHSCSKYLGGHADIISGVLATSQDNLFRELKTIQRYRGATPSAFDCYLLQRSLQTLEVRMERHHLSSIEVANFLEAHPKIITVNHPLLKSSPYRSLALTQHGGRHSGMLAFYLKGGRSEAVTFLDKTKIIKRAASLGGTHSLASHPRSLTHNAKLVPEAEAEAAGITENLIRLSVGLENVQDLMADLEQALAQI